MNKSLYIDGAWRAGAAGRTGDVFDPSTGAVIGSVAFAEVSDLDDALAAAHCSFRDWADTSAYNRAAILRKAAAHARDRAEDIAQAIMRENGKPLSEARMEAGGTGDHIDWFAEEARRTYGRVIPSRQPEIEQKVILEPVGPVAAFSPWNFPIGQLVRKIAGALAAGCTIIAKAPEETPTSAMILVECFEAAGVPAGVLNLVFGVPSDISEHLIPSPVIRKISFTGSVPVGALLGEMAGRHIKRATMELGGHAPFIVCEDVDVAKVLPLAVGLKYRNAGQVCASPTRFLVEAPKFDAFLDGFVKGAEGLKVGAGTEEGVAMGPLTHARRLDVMTELVEDAVAKGAELKTGGNRVGNEGWFFAPTVLANVPTDARIMNEEPFGPIAIVNRFDSFDAAVEEANRLPFGLAAFGFSNRADRTHAMAKQIETGMMSINHFGLAAPETPFGGVKDSGYGSESGAEGIMAYLTPKLVSQLNG